MRSKLLFIALLVRFDAEGNKLKYVISADSIFFTQITVWGGNLQKRFCYIF